MTEIIAVTNQKGGVGKSTTSMALGAGLSLRGLKTLLIDLDAQGNLSYTAGMESGLSSMDVLMGEDIKKAINRGGINDIIPSSPALATADLAINQTGKEYRLREALLPILGDYDYIILDTPPALGILTVNALTAANSAIIPAFADIFSLQGIGQLYSTIEAVRKYTNPALLIRGILLTRFNPRAVLSRDMRELLNQTAEQLGTKVFDTYIRDGIAVKEAQAVRTDLFSYSPASTTAQDYSRFIDELLESNRK